MMLEVGSEGELTPQPAHPHLGLSIQANSAQPGLRPKPCLQLSPPGLADLRTVLRPAQHTRIPQNRHGTRAGSLLLRNQRQQPRRQSGVMQRQPPPSPSPSETEQQPRLNPREKNFQPTAGGKEAAQDAPTAQDLGQKHKKQGLKGLRGAQVGHGQQDLQQAPACFGASKPRG